jgi:ABC-type Mn2+/Zn2+ transport system permease subunit
MDLLEPLQSGIDRRALIELCVVGGTCAALGWWIVVFRLSFAAESLAHGMLPGLVLAALAGAPLVLGGVGGVVATALATWLAGRDERVGHDAATPAVAATAMIGLGGLLALATDAPTRLEELLFGDPLGVGDDDIAIGGAFAVMGIAALVALHRPLCAVAFDPVGARALGLRPVALALVVLVLLAAALAIAVQALGSLLVLAVMVAPVVAVRRHCGSPGRAMALAGATAVGAGIAGIYASHLLGTAAGASVALALCLAAAGGAALPTRQAARAAAGGPLRSRASQ